MPPENRRIRVFVSSTFKDMVEDLNTLMLPSRAVDRAAEVGGADICNPCPPCFRSTIPSQNSRRSAS